MLALALLLVGCAALQSNAFPALVQYQAQDELGQYSYGYSGGPSAKQEERTLDGVTRGSYSYIDGNGIVQTRSYEADDLHGFRVVGTDISNPTTASRSGAILPSAGLPVYDHTPFFKNYRPVSVPYKSVYNDIQSFSGNEISVTPVSPPLYRKTITPYSLEYLKTPYRFEVPQPAKYYQQHYISPNSLDITPLSSVGIRVPTSYSQPIAYSDSGVQSTVTPPTVYAHEVPVPASIQESPYYQTASSKIVSGYSPLSYRANVVAISNANLAPISYLDAAPGPFDEPSPTLVAVPAAAAQPAVAVSNPDPVAVYSYYPATPTFNRYAFAAPSVSATVYEPAGGYLAAKPVPLQEAIATQYHAQDELGQYRYGYANINSAKEESKTIDGVTRGSFSYVDANGVLQSRTYVSDDVNGFRVIGTDIPKDPNGHVNPDAIPSDHVAAGPEVVPATILSHDIVHVNSPVVVSSTHAPYTILQK